MKEEKQASLTCLSVLSAPTTSTSNGTRGSSCLAYSSRSPAWFCAWSRDGEWLASCYGSPDPCIRIWKQAPEASVTDSREERVEDWVLFATLTGIHERTVRSLAFSPCLGHGPVLASASFDGTVAIWEYDPEGDTALGEENGWECTAQLEGHDNEVKCVAWNSTGSLLATCGRDKSVWIWECFLAGTIGGPTYSNDAGGEGGEFECLAVLHGHEGDVKSIEFAPSHGQWGDGDEILLSASYDDTIKCWAEDGGDWYCATTLSTHTSTVWSIATAPGGGRLVSGSDDGSLAIFKHYTASEKEALFPGEEGGSGTGLWKCVGKLPSAHSRAVYSVNCAPARSGHGRIASAGADNRIQIYREVSGSSSDQPLFCVDAATDSAHGDGDVNGICWHPLDGSLMASAGDDGNVRIWRYCA